MKEAKNILVSAGISIATVALIIGMVVLGVEFSEREREPAHIYGKWETLIVTTRTITQQRICKDCGWSETKRIVN